MALPTNVRLAWANSLAYSIAATVTKKKKFYNLDTNCFSANDRRSFVVTLAVRFLRGGRFERDAKFSSASLSLDSLSPEDNAINLFSSSPAPKANKQECLSATNLLPPSLMFESEAEAYPSGDS